MDTGALGSGTSDTACMETAPLFEAHLLRLHTIPLLTFDMICWPTKLQVSPNSRCSLLQGLLRYWPDLMKLLCLLKHVLQWNSLQLCSCRPRDSHGQENHIPSYSLARCQIRIEKEPDLCRNSDFLLHFVLFMLFFFLLWPSHYFQRDICNQFQHN